VRDIATSLSVARSAVSSALQGLSRAGLVNYERYEPVTLSPEGRRMAMNVALSHRVLAEFLKGVLAVDAERAEAIACRMEHAVDREVLNRFACFLAFLGRQRCEGGKDWVAEFRRFLREGADRMTCEEHMRQYLLGAGKAEPKAEM